MSTARRILAIIRPHFGLALGSFACMGVMSATTVGYAWLAGPILGTIHRPPEHPALLGIGTADLASVVAALAASVLAITLARGVAAYGQRMLAARLGQKVVRSLRERMYAHLLRAAPDVLLSKRRGELAARLASDASQVQSLVATNLASVLGDVVTLVGLATLAFSLDARLATVALAAVPPIAVIVFLLARRVRAAHRRVWERYADLSSHAAELADMVPIIRAYGAEERAVGMFSEHAAELEARVLAASRWSAIANPAVQLLGGLALAGALFFAAPLLSSGEIAPDTFVSFFAAVFFVYRPVLGLGQAVQRVAGGLSALDRTDEVLDLAVEPQDAPDAVDAPRLSEALTLHGVSFSYRAGEPVLEGIDLRIEPGESVALVGGSGEGKTTLLRIMLGLLRPDEGEVRIDGRSVEAVTRASWRRQFAWVTQEPLIFGDTILANVALADGNEAERERARAALAMAGATPLIESLEKGMDTVLSEGGKELSGGQRQRICIARALYRDAPVLIFDEATSSLDGPAERAIAATIETLMAERTVVLVSHRLSTVARAQRVLVLRGGTVVESGSPLSLWETGGQFHDLFRNAIIQ